MVFQLVVEGSRLHGRGAAAPGGGAAVPGAASVFETFLGPHGEELPVAPLSGADGASPASASAEALPPRESAVTEAGQREQKVDELVVRRVRLFRTGGLGGLAGGREGHRGIEGTLPMQRTSALLLVAVPVELSLVGLRQFFGASLEDDVETLRVLRWASPLEGDSAGGGSGSRNSGVCSSAASPTAADDGSSEGDAAGSLSGDFYAVVILCRTQAAADSLYQAHHGRIMTECRQEGSAASVYAAPTRGDESIGGPCCYLLFLEAIAYHEADPTESGDDALAGAEVPNAAVELPMCPFCLERLDVSVTGMITHNAGWLSSMEWDEVPHSRCCAACAAIDRAARVLAGAEEGPLPACQRCASGENLWVCLVCGHFGCGRYAAGHAKDHACERSHHFCLDLSSGRIWHYAGDVFVHRRLVQMAAASGRFEVALPDPADEVAGPAAGSSGSYGTDPSGKGPDALREGHLAMELDAVLASQLDYQRSLYEAKLRAEAERQRGELEKLRAAVAAEEGQQRGLEANIADLQQEQRRLERRCTTAQQSRAKAEEELNFAKEMNRSLLANRAEMKRKAESAGGGGSSSGGGGEAAAGASEDALVLRLRKQVAKLMEAISAEEQQT